MKKCVFVLFFLVGIKAVAQDSRINHLIRTKDLPKANALLKKNTTLSRDAKTIYSAVLLNAFGQADSSAKLLRSIRNPRRIADDTLRYFYYSTSYDNSVKLFAYRKAVSYGNYVTGHFPTFFTKEDLEKEKQAILIWKALHNVPAQAIHRRDSVRIHLDRDIAGLWTLPVQAKDSSYDFVFDSGAGLSVVTASYASKLNIKPIPGVTVPVSSGVTGLETPAQIGVAPQMQIKDITVSNAVFLIFPDEALSFANGAYTIKGIIGFPVISEMGVLHFTQDDLLITNKSRNKKMVANMMIDQLKPVIYLEYENDLLPFTFDFGAKTTIFSDVFYKRYKKQLQRTGISTLETVGGASGQVSLQVLEMPELRLKSNGRKIILKNIAVSKEPISTNSDLYYGNIGQDVIGQFRTMVISFKDCFIRFDN